MLQFQSLTNLPCGLESNNNIATAGVIMMDEEDASADDDEHIRNGRANDEQKPFYDRSSELMTTSNDLVNSGHQNDSGIEKIRIDYPKKFHNVRSMSLSMERNAFCEMCRIPRSPVPFDLVSGGDRERDDDKGARRYFGFTIKQYMALVSLALVDFLGFCSMSVMAPTFPKEVSTLSFRRLHVKIFPVNISLLKIALVNNIQCWG